MKIRSRQGFTPFKTQLDDLAFFASNSRACNFSEMGAGKSWPVAQLSLGVLEDGLCDFSIIVTPKIVLDDWRDIFANQLDCDWRSLVTMYHAPSSVRPSIKFRPIIITTYETMTADFDRLYELACNARCMITFDEAHRLKNYGTWNQSRQRWEGSARTGMAYQLSYKAKRLYGLTGTPTSNGLQNAYSYIHMMTGIRHYATYNLFMLRHLEYDGRRLVGIKNVNDIQDILASFSVRHMKREVLELPPVVFQTRLLDWDPEQRKVYQKMYEESVIELKDHWLEATSAGAQLVRMHQILTNPMQLGLSCTSTRWKAIDDDLESIGMDQHKVVIAAYYRDTVKRLAAQLKRYNPAVIFGETKDMEAEKWKLINDPTCRVGIINPKSGGIGCNFTVSDYFIMFEYAYDLEDYDQFVGRGNRPGQTNKLTVINYAVRGSMEQRKILPRLIDKKNFSANLLRDPLELLEFLRVEDLDGPINF